MADYKPLQNIAYEYIREKVYSRELEFGMIYSETRLARELSISRTPIRDALNRLSRERYIDILPNKGFMLHKPSRKETQEAYHVRMMIECYCGEHLAKNIATDEAQATLAHMEQCHEAQVALLNCESRVDLRRFWEADYDFHIALLHHMDFSATNMQYDSFMHIFMPQYLKDDYVLGRNHSTIVEHNAILQGLKTGDPQKAHSAIEKHLDSSFRLCLLNAQLDE